MVERCEKKINNNYIPWPENDELKRIFEFNILFTIFFTEIKLFSD